jgi:hypothetical protein
MRPSRAARLRHAVILLAFAGCAACRGKGAAGPEDRDVWQESLRHDGAGLLDGRAFECEVGEKGKAAGDHERLEFHGGRFHSAGCDEYRFATAPYVGKAEGDAVAFEAATKSPTEGEIAWRGSVRGDSIEGTFTWTKSGQAPLEYWFKGAKAP